jgi:hypothetical protein
MKMIDYFGKKYYFDIDAIMEWCFTSTVNPFRETELNEGYDTNDDGEMVMMTKVVRELKTPNSQYDTIRYDFIKLLMGPFLTDITENEITTSFSYTIMFNTLIDKKFLIEISEN